MEQIRTPKLTADELRLTRMFKALGNPVRLEILRQLAECQSCICNDIVAVLPLAQSTVSQHLKVLKEAGLIRGEIEGVRDGDMLLVDGGWVERVPVICARNMGADVVIAVDVSSEIAKFEETSGLDIVLRADAVTRVFLNELLLDEADVSVHPDVGGVHWADFSDPRELIRQGELATLERMVAIRCAIHRASAPQRKLVDQIKVIKDIILEKVVGPKQ